MLVAGVAVEMSAVGRYDRLSLERLIEREDDLGTCPTAGCPFKFAWDEANRKLECPVCSNRTPARTSHPFPRFLHAPFPTADTSNTPALTPDVRQVVLPGVPL